MEHVVASWGKVNLSLRVTGRRRDGYHTLHSLFLRVGPMEAMRLRSRSGARREDLLRLRSEVPISGENLVLRALALVRRYHKTFPFFEVELQKHIPPGSGLGAGSGNAAAILSWARQQGFPVPDVSAVASLGADVPFLASSWPGGRGEGIGDDLSPFFPPALRVALVVPRWSCATGLAFAALDRTRGGDWSPLEEARRESDRLLENLAAGKRVGLLPNDFGPDLWAAHGEYKDFFDLAEEQGALGWGISGSGGAALALFPRDKTLRWPDFSWARMGTILEV